MTRKVDRMRKAFGMNLRRMPGMFRRRPTLEVHVPIAPKPYFLNQLRCLTHSLRRFGGSYRDAPVIATVGGDEVDEGLAGRMPWLAANGIELRWVPQSEYARIGLHATGATRLKQAFRSDMILLLDADTLIRRPLDSLIDRAWEDRVLSGVIAHVPPFHSGKLDSPDWATLFAACGLVAPPLAYEHTGWGYMLDEPRNRYCPPYFNYGVIAAPADVISRIGGLSETYLSRLQEVVASYFDAQIALCMAIVQLGIPVRALPLRYNMANNPHLEALHHREIEHAVILHLLAEQKFRRDEAFASLSNLEALLARTDLRVTNLLAQEVIRSIFPALVSEERDNLVAA